MFGGGGSSAAIAHGVTALSDRVATGSFNMRGMRDRGWSDERVLPNARRPDTYEREREREEGGSKLNITAIYSPGLSQMQLKLLPWACWLGLGPSSPATEHYPSN